MKRYEHNFKEEAVKFSDEIGVKKARKQLIINYATLKKGKNYQIDTTELTVKQVKTIVWRCTFAYYKTKRITTVNLGRLSPVAFKKKNNSFLFQSLYY